MSEEIKIEVVKNTQQLSDHERRIGDLEIDIKPMTRLVAMYELQMEQTHEIKETMKSINENLNNLNHDVKYMKDKQDHMDARVSNIEKDREDDLEKFKDKSIDFYLKIVGGVILAGLLIWLGLK